MKNYITFLALLFSMSCLGQVKSSIPVTRAGGGATAENAMQLVGIPGEQYALKTFAQARGNHTGVQAISTITGLQGALDATNNAVALKAPIASPVFSDVVKVGTDTLATLRNLRETGGTGGGSITLLNTTGTSTTAAMTQGSTTTALGLKMDKTNVGFRVGTTGFLEIKDANNVWWRITVDIDGSLTTTAL